MYMSTTRATMPMPSQYWSGPKKESKAGLSNGSNQSTKRLMITAVTAKGMVTIRPAERVRLIWPPVALSTCEGVFIGNSF